MQTNILRSFALVAVGNAALSGKNVSAFAHSDLHKFYKQTEFVVPRGGDQYTQVAPDPLAWFAKLRELGCRGLRLHNAPMQQREGMGPQSERMLVGMVGGGPRWLIETVMPARCEVWEGYDRLGDRNDPEQRIWLSAYLMLGESGTQDFAHCDIAAASDAVRAAITDAEALARSMSASGVGGYAGMFGDQLAAALKTLDGAASRYPGIEFLALTELTPSAKQLIGASAEAWLFGGMGSWNDMAPTPEMEPRYEAVSEALFNALKRAVIAAANSSYRG